MHTPSHIHTLSPIHSTSNGGVSTHPIWWWYKKVSQREHAHDMMIVQIHIHITRYLCLSHPSTLSSSSSSSFHSHTSASHKTHNLLLLLLLLLNHPPVMFTQLCVWCYAPPHHHTVSQLSWESVEEEWCVWMHHTQTKGHRLHLSVIHREGYII